ncbi:MAG TPA: hypothetical protein VK694_04150 [Verrucomicrobiae bacterium]|nr:hypothetical protein [Verrucomicrobiae bacterium]
MKRALIRPRSLAAALSLSVILLSTAGSAYAAATTSDGSKQTPPPSNVTSGPQDKPPIEAGSQDAQPTEPLGPTELVKTDVAGRLQTPSALAAPLAGAVANVDFATPLQYCSRNLLNTPVRNTTAVSKSIRVRVLNQSTWREVYTTVAANSTSYPAFYGIHGAYNAYLYVWNGSAYVYDETRTGTHTCSVAVTRTSNAGGWVQLKIQNTGTAYASQKSSELAPFPAAGTYTGTHYDYPAAGGAAIYRWFWVGTSPYGIVSSTLGSFNTPYLFSGDL